MTTTDELRDRLQALPPPLVSSPDLADDLLAKVRSERRTGQIAAATVAVVAVGVGATYFLGPGPAVPEQQAGAGTSITITTTAAAAAPTSTERLVPGPLPSLGTFPFTPGRPHAYTLGLGGGGSELHSNSNASHIPSGPDVHVSPSPARPDDDTVIGTTTTTVRGMPAELVRMTSKVKVVWQEQPGQWVVVESSSLGEAEVVRYAQELRPEPQPIPSPLNFAWLPAGMSAVVTSDGATDESVVFAPDDGSRTIGVSRNGNDVGKVGTPIPVGDRTGLLSAMNGVTILWVPLPGHGNLSVSVPDAVGFTQEDLVRFTGGITDN